VEVKRQIGVVPEEWVVRAINGSGVSCGFVGRNVRAGSRDNGKARGKQLLEFMQLADREKTLIADYSHGMQKKLALASAVIHGPRILFSG